MAIIQITIDDKQINFYKQLLRQLKCKYKLMDSVQKKRPIQYSVNDKTRKKAQQERNKSLKEILDKIDKTRSNK